MKNRVEELTVRLLDGLLSDEEFEELERLVAAPELAETQAGLCELEALLRGLRRPDVSEGVLDRLRLERVRRIEGRVMERVRRIPGPRPTPTPATRWAWGVAAVLLISVALTIVWTAHSKPLPESARAPSAPNPTSAPSDPAPPPPKDPAPPPKPAPTPDPPTLQPSLVPVPVPIPEPAPPPTPAPSPAARTTVVAAEAAVERVEGEVVLIEGSTKSPAVAGTALPAGRTLLTSGRGSRAVVVWPDKTRAELEPETRLARLEDKTLFLEKGSISVTTSAPMAVRTPQAEAKVLGTTFKVAVLPTVTRLSVLEGKVRLTRLSDRASAEIPAGFFGVAGTGARPSARAVDPLPAPPPGKEWSQTFGEEFDEAKIDRARWVVAQEVRKGSVWHPRNVQVEDGRLAITTSRVGDRWVGGSLSTAGKFEQTFGYFSARIQFPTQPGHRPVFGLGCKLSPAGGREGMLVHIADKPEQSDLLHHYLHWGGVGTVWSRWDVPGRGVVENWHTFGLWWTPEEYVFYVDGRETWRTRIGGVSQVPEHLFLSDEVDEAAGDIRRATLPDQFLVDHVRAYTLVPAEHER